MNPPPTRVRYSMLGLLCLLAMITYMDRAMYGSAKQSMMDAVGRPVSDFFWVLVAFQLAYALFEIPTGWLGDRFGPRSTLLRIVVWWSLFVALTAFAGLAIPGTAFIPISFGVLIAMQALFGMGEAGAFPNISKAAYNWFPATQRGFAKGAVWMSARLMGGLTPLIWVVLTVYAGLDWREALWLFSGVAAAWCVLFWICFRNQPSEHPACNEAERVLVEGTRGDTYAKGPTPWKTIFTSRNLWALCVMYMVTNYNWYFLMYYLPGALKAEFFKASVQTADTLALGGLGGGAVAITDTVVYGDPLVPALLGGGPLLIGMFGCFFGGRLSDNYIRRTGDRKWGRRLYGMLGYGLAGACYAAAAMLVNGNFWLFATALILVGLFNDLMMGPAWATAQDIGQRYAAIVSGTMNMIGNLGATLGILITGLILKEYTILGEVQPMGFVYCFGMYAVVYMIGVISWMFIDPSRPIVPEPATPPTESPSPAAEAS